MFGDSLSPVAKLVFGEKFDPDNPNSPSGPNTNFADTELPLGGAGGRYLPIGENNKPIPTDRIFFLYNGFQNAASTFDPGLQRDVDADLNRYTFGFEKTFQDGLSSLEIRFPLADELTSNTPFFSSATGNVGNLNLLCKHLLYQNEQLALAVGLGLGLPTGSDVTGTLNGTPFRLQNDAVYLLPYVGGTYAEDDWFLTAYLQIDVATHGDEILVDGFGSQGRLNAPTFGRVDLSLGHWLIQDAGFRHLDGIAAVVEAHYVTTLTDADNVVLNIPGDFDLGYSENRVDFLNLTVGLHLQVNDQTNFRVGGVFPLRDDPDRQFDSEIQASFNREF
jgi:hypothetical protein